MGAYENPQIITDTQSGQHLMNLQASIASSFGDVAKSYKVKQDEIRKKLEENKLQIQKVEQETEEYAFALRTGVNKLKTSNGKINMGETFEPLIQEAVKLKSGLLNNSITGQDRQLAMQKLADINSTVSGNFTESLASLGGFAEDVEKAMLRGVGKEGGLAKDMTGEQIKAIRILQGKLDGTKKAVYLNGNPNDLMWEVYDKDNNLIQSYSAAKLKKMDELGNEYVKLVPDRTADSEALRAESTSIFETKPLDPRDPSKGNTATGRILDAYLVKDGNGMVKTSKEYIDKEKTKYRLVHEVNKADIRKALDTKLDVQLAGMTDEELMLYTNNVVDPRRIEKGLDTSCFDSDNVLSKEERIAAEEMYKEYFVDTQVANKQPVLKEDSDIAIFEEPRTNPNPGGSNNKNEPTRSQLEKAEEDKKTIQELYSIEAGTRGDFGLSNGRSVMHDGKDFIVQTTGDNKGQKIDGSKADVIKYLKTGKFKVKK